MFLSNAIPRISKSLLCIFVEIKSLKFNPLSGNPTKCSNTLKQFVGCEPTNCLGVFAHFVWVGAYRVKVSVSSIFLRMYIKTK